LFGKTPSHREGGGELQAREGIEKPVIVPRANKIGEKQKGGGNSKKTLNIKGREGSRARKSKAVSRANQSKLQRPLAQRGDKRQSRNWGKGQISQ